MTLSGQSSAATRSTLGVLELQLGGWYDYRHLLSQRIRFFEYGDYRAAASTDSSPVDE
jgi:hypothetical protein